MSQRTVSVVLKAQIDNYVANMTAAERRTLDVERAMKSASQRFEAQTRAIDAAGKGFLVAGAAAAAGLGLVIKASAEYGAKMAQLQSLSHASQGDMQRLSAAAMTQGTAFGQSASQVAEAEIELTKAGRDASQILGGDLKGALALAAAGQMDVAAATTIGVTAVTQFAKSGATIPHVADLLAAGADKALGSVDQLGQALNQGGLVAAQMGLNVDQTVGTLSAFAQAGLLGSDAGTSFKNMLLMLQSPSKQAQALLEKYNITAYDTQGHFVGMTTLAGELTAAFKGKSDAERDAALSTIFGSDAIRSANVLYKEGASGIQGWIDKVNVSGFASAQAAGKMNSLQGDTQKLAAAFQTDLVKAGTSADGALRGVVQSATAVVTAVGGIPAPLQSGLMAATALTAGVGLLGGAFLVAVPKAAAFKDGLRTLNLTGRQAAGIFGKGTALLAGIAAVTAGFAAMGTTGTANGQQVEQAAVSMSKGWGKLDGSFKNAGLALGSGTGLKNALDALGNGNFFSQAGSTKWFDGATLGITHFADVYKANEETFDALGQQIAGLSKKDYGAATQSFSALVSQYKLSADQTKNLLQYMPAYRDALTELAGKSHITASETNLVNLAQGKGAVSAKVLAAAQAEAAAASAKQADVMTALSGSAISAKTDISDLQKTIEGFGSAQLDARSATRAMYQSIDDADAALKKNGRTLDVHTQAGRDNQAALDGIATAADNAASKTLEQTGRADKAADVMKKGRDEFIRVATAMTGSATEAKNLADQLGLIPSNVKVAVQGTGFDEAKNNLRRLQEKLDGLQSKKITVQVATQIDVANSQIRVAAMAASGVDYFGNPVRKAGGGEISGSGPKGVDSVPALLAPNEHVWTSGEVDAVGGHGNVYRIRQAARSGTLSGFAVGGAASDAAQRRLALAQAREDFVSGQRRGGSDPLAYVDELRSMSRQGDTYSSARRRSFDAAANRYESSIVKLAASSEKASQKLNDLRTASSQMHASITSAISGGYSATGAGASMTAAGTITRDGMRFTNYTSGPTGAGLAAYYKAGAASSGAFARDLKTLASRGINGGLLAEIAGYGVAQGAPLADALLSATRTQVATINAGYAAIGRNASTAGWAVADDTYKKQIDAADKNAGRITAQLRADGEKLRKLIASAFGLHGYASGTDSATPGVHLVGEHGPELVGFRGGEWVANANDTGRWIRAGGGQAGGRTIRVQVALPQSMDLVDSGGGLITTVGVVARQVAVQEIHADALSDAVLMAGGAA